MDLAVQGVNEEGEAETCHGSMPSSVHICELSP